MYVLCFLTQVSSSIAINSFMLYALSGTWHACQCLLVLVMYMTLKLHTVNHELCRVDINLRFPGVWYLSMPLYPS